jgi:multidrug efflux pump subunit AcrB
VTREAVRQVAAVKFPFEYHAQVRGEQVERRTALRSIYAEIVAALIVVFLLFQAATGSWRISLLSVLAVPVALLGGLVAAVIGGGVFKLGSLLGFVTILGLTVRASLMLVKRFQNLERSGAEQFGEGLVQRGVREQFGPIVATAITVALAALPFIVMGDVSGLEIAHPMALAILGGMVTSVFASLVMIPALYLRFGGGSAANIINLDEAPA